MLSGRNRLLYYAVLLSVALHATAFVLTGDQFRHSAVPEAPEPEEFITTEVAPPPDKTSRAEEEPPTPTAPDETIKLVTVNPVTAPAAKPEPAIQKAPPPPTAEEWAFASTYKLKNSKGYRYTWGQQVRSMMGTAIEGPDQGMVRFQVEIAPDGRIVRVETLWTTSDVAEQRARQAIQNMPKLPPTPTGKPLIFEKTISFSPYFENAKPTYRDDCQPEPPAFESPYTWDGKSPQVWVPPKPVEKPDPQAIEECKKQLPLESIEAEMARTEELMGRWTTRESGQ